MLAKKNGGTFPLETVYEFIWSMVVAHGTRVMPIWGRLYNRDTLSYFFDPKALDKMRPSSAMPASRITGRSGRAFTPLRKVNSVSMARTRASSASTFAASDFCALLIMPTHCNDAVINPPPATR